MASLRDRINDLATRIVAEINLVRAEATGKADVDHSHPYDAITLEGVGPGRWTKVMEVTVDGDDHDFLIGFTAAGIGGWDYGRCFVEIYGVSAYLEVRESFSTISNALQERFALTCQVSGEARTWALWVSSDLGRVTITQDFIGGRGVVTPTWLSEQPWLADTPAPAAGDIGRRTIPIEEIGYYPTENAWEYVLTGTGWALAEGSGDPLDYFYDNYASLWDDVPTYLPGILVHHEGNLYQAMEAIDAGIEPLPDGFAPWRHIRALTPPATDVAMDARFLDNDYYSTWVDQNYIQGSFVQYQGSIYYANAPIAAGSAAPAANANWRRYRIFEDHGHDVGDLPVANDGESTASKVVRADDQRLSNARTPSAHSHDDRYYTELEVQDQFVQRRLGAPEERTTAQGTSGTVTLNLSNASVFTLSPTGTVSSLVIDSVPFGTAVTVTLIVTQGGTARSIATPAGGVFVGSASPTQVANKICVFTYFTVDGGSTWICSAAVQV